MFEGLDHIAIAVENTEEALEIWRDKLGFPVLYSEDVNDATVRLTHLDLGAAQLQLVEPLTPDHPLRDWLRENGSGLHHLCMKVKDVGATKDEAAVKGMATAPNIHQGTKGKRALFFDKSATGGPLLEVTGA